jgi:hypothetical protein
MDPAHPIFASFPTDFHTNWQWWSIVRNSHPLILDKADKSFRPLVQMVDNVERNHKLGLLFEFKVGDGKLLVCMSALQKMQSRPEAAQLFYSILQYMNSDHFEPKYVAEEELLRGLGLK